MTTNMKREQLSTMWERATLDRSKMGSEMAEAFSITTMVATIKDTGKTTKCMVKVVCTMPTVALLMMAVGIWITSMAKAKSTTTAHNLPLSLLTTKC